MSMVELIQRHMGGTWILRCFADIHRHTAIRQLFEEAFVELQRLENLLTDFRPSPFNRINDMAGIEAVVVPPEIFDLLATALEYSRLSDGIFDISYASVGHLWRSARLKNEMPSELQIAAAAKQIDYRKIVLHQNNCSVYLPHPDMKIGLGGIGKGYAVDKIFDFLKERGLDNFYVNGAGDIRVDSAPQAPRPWRIGIRNPLSKNPDHKMGMLNLKNAAIATSGDYVNFIPHQGRKWHHLIDPKSGFPSLGVISATVIAASAVRADVCASVALLKGLDEGMKFLNRENLQGILVNCEGEVFLSQASLDQLKSDMQQEGTYAH